MDAPGPKPLRRRPALGGQRTIDDDVNYAAIIENGLLVVIAFGFLGLLTGGFVKDNRLRVALLLGIGVIGVVIYMLTVNGGGGEPVI